MPRLDSDIAFKLPQEYPEYPRMRGCRYIHTPTDPKPEPQKSLVWRNTKVVINFEKGSEGGGNEIVFSIENFYFEL